MNGLPGIGGGSIGACAWCGKSFAFEILMGRTVPVFQIGQVKGDLAAHRKCLKLLKKTKSILEWPAESPIRIAIEQHNKKFAEAEVKYKVKEFRPGLYHVMDGPTPIYGKGSDGNDKPLVFHDADAADECARKMNEERRL